MAFFASFAMRVRRLPEIREMIASPEFLEWWGQLVAARVALADAEAARDELLAQLTLMEFRSELTQKNAIDTLYRAGEHEDGAAQSLAEATELENRSFPGVAAFEEQRFKVSEIWYRFGAADRALEDARDQEQSPAMLDALERRHRALADEYEREIARRKRLWDEVERLWARSTEVSLMTCEERVLARKVRKESEALFGLAEERKKKAQTIKLEAECAATAVEKARTALAMLRTRARDLFGAAVGIDFLYFRQKDDQKQALAVALVDDHTAYNVEVRAHAVYSVDRERGVGFLEPARASVPSPEEGDRRFEVYFLTGRKGASHP